MIVEIHSVDWYHCNIYRPRVLFPSKLIAEVALTLDGELTMTLRSFRKKVRAYIPDMAMQAYYFMAFAREENE